MPKSKSRKKPRSTRPPRRPTATAAEYANSEGVRTEFVQRATTAGHPFPAIKGYEPTGIVGECWTNAWTYSQATGLGYAEGVALMPDGWHAHAWCVTDDGAVIECTAGYDKGTEYRGWCLDPTKVAILNAVTNTDDPACSILEAGIGSGVAPWEQIIAEFTYIPGTV